MARLGKAAVATVVGSLLADIAYAVLDPELGT
jgi:ABC-type dipeptide/oligopeptide/nickel transport system permease component